MIGITLSSEQIRTAPAEVRRWIEHEVAVSLGLHVQTPDSQGRTEQLAICSLDELATILSLVQGVFPAVNVFFELGRKGASCAKPPFRIRITLLHSGRPNPNLSTHSLDRGRYTSERDLH
jgi:hypothetical protein